MSATLGEVARGELAESTHPGIVIGADDGLSRALPPAAVAVIEQPELAELAIVERRCESALRNP